jgi:glycosyltransferase involved in cell wall biosynthesis
MRILHVSSARTYGGGEKHLVDLCRGLHDAGHEIYVALRPTNEWQSRLDFLPTGRILHVTLRNSFGMFSAKRIARFMRRNSIQVIHAHLARDYVPASIAARLADDSVFILTRHVLFPMKSYYRFAVRNLSAAIGVSEASAEAMSRVFDRSVIRIVRNGIDAHDLDPVVKGRMRTGFRSEHDLPEDCPLVGIIGELTVNKGQSVFLDAASLVAAAHPDARFIIVGRDHSPDHSQIGALRALAESLGISDKVSFVEWVEDTASLFAAVDVVVSASYSESFGLAMLEAMAEGSAVVATSTEGARELLAEGRCGILVPVGDAREMSRAVSRIIEDPALARSLGTEAAAVAKENFSRSEMIARTIEVYEEACRNAGRSDG